MVEGKGDYLDLNRSRLLHGFSINMSTTSPPEEGVANSSIDLSSYDDLSSSSAMNGRNDDSDIEDSNDDSDIEDSTSDDEGEEIDFLQDDPSDMTNGRRIAKMLMKFQLYYPNKNNGYNQATGDDTLNDDGVDVVDLSGRELEPPSLAKAWAFFEHMILPRYVVDNQPKKDKAEQGQNLLPTKLYNPFFSSMEDLGGFGLGIALYFATLRALLLLLVVAGLTSLPNILHFSSEEYSNGQPGVGRLLKGSAVCTEYEYVPCLDCSENFSDESKHYRLQFQTSQSGEEVTLALKNNCDGSNMTTITSHLITMLVIVIGLAFISYFIGKQEEDIDENEQTAKDYSIEILNPPKDAGDPEEWKEFFIQNFVDVSVICCTIAVKNDDLIKNLVGRRELLQIIRKALPVGKKSLDKNDIKAVVDEIRDKGRRRFIHKGLPEFYDELLMVDEKIKHLAVHDKVVTSVFVTFERESSQRRVLRALHENKSRYSFRGGHEPLRVKEAAEPCAVRWRDLSASRSQSLKSLILPFTMTLILLAVSIAIVYFLRRGIRLFNGQRFVGKPIYGSFAVSFMNFFFPMFAKTLTEREIHRREGKKQTSLYIKYALFRWVNTVLVIFIITVRNIIFDRF